MSYERRSLVLFRYFIIIYVFFLDRLRFVAYNDDNDDDDEFNIRIQQCKPSRLNTSLH